MGARGADGRASGPGLGDPCSKRIVLRKRLFSCFLFVFVIIASSPIENETQNSDASNEEMADMKKQIENYRSIISKQEHLLQVSHLHALNIVLFHSILISCEILVNFVW